MKKLELSVLTIAVMGALASTGALASEEGFFSGLLPVGGVRFADDFDLERSLNAIESAPSIRALLARDHAHQLKEEAAASDAAVSTVRYKHFYKGIEVVGSQAFLHVAQAASEADDRLLRFDLDTTPKLSASQAAALAQSYSGADPLRAEPSLKIMGKDEGSARLVYSVPLKGGLVQSGRDVQIDAQTGELLAEIPDHVNIAPIQVYSAAKQGIAISPQFQPDPQNPGKQALQSCAVMDLSNGQTSRVDGQACDKLVKSACQVLSMSGSPYTINPQDCQLANRNGTQGPGSDDAVLRAAQNSARVLAYYLQVHGRNGFDNRGSTVTSVVHVGHGYDNAFWIQDGEFMSYGDGDGKEMGDFTRGVDVAGHELTHGVVQHTANLGRIGETGSLNEGYADYFGKMIENKNDWLLGAELFLHPAPGKGIRNLADPASLTGQFTRNGKVVETPYPTKMSEMAPTRGACTAQNDFCWVHFNATVPGHASYLITQAIGPEKTQRLYYVTLSQFLGETAKFKDAAQATLKACAKLFDQGTCGEVEQAFASVQML